MIDRDLLARVLARFIPRRELVLMVATRLLVSYAAHEASLAMDGPMAKVLAFVSHAALFMSAFALLGHVEKTFHLHVLKAFDLWRAQREATVRSSLISAAYVKLISRAHADDKRWGSTGHLWAPLVDEIAAATQAVSILDYGCGKRSLEKTLQHRKITPYDPAIPRLSALPKPHALVVCSNVLEHVEPDCVRNVIRHLARLSRRAALIVVSTRDAKSILTEDRRPHRTVQTADWWADRIGQHFHIVHARLDDRDGDLAFLAVPRRMGSSMRAAQLGKRLPAMGGKAPRSPSTVVPLRATSA